jgi:membrane-associated phospholipid phosphatase
MAQTLVHARWRRPAQLVAALGGLLLIALGIVTFHGTNTGFDSWVLRVAFFHIGGYGAQVLLNLSTPAISVALLAVVVVSAAIARRVDLVLLAVLAPTLGVLMTEDVLKPLVDRRIGPNALLGGDGHSSSLAFPSGHETFVACTALVLFVAIGQLTVGRRARWGTSALLAIWMTGAAVGLVRNFWHYTTDTIGAVGLAFAVVIGGALVIDRWLPALGRRKPALAPAEPERERQLTPRS